MKNSNFGDLVKNDVKNIIDYLTCKLCQGIYRNPITITQCNHSFCKSCILLVLYNKDPVCPLCKTNLGSKPKDYLISDSSLERFVEIIFPEFKEIEENEEVKFT